jgi:cytochrome c-type biogenesis protein CcmH
MKLRNLALVSIACLALAAGTAQAIQPDEILPDAALEARAREIGKELRCLVCQNQSIDDSDADLARDLRTVVRQRLVAGDSDDQVEQFVVNRYGDYVLLKPPFKVSTLALWLGPLAILICALGMAATFYRRRQDESPPSKSLSKEETKRLKALLDSAEPENKDVI